jgi:hypothetical protein
MRRRPYRAREDGAVTLAHLEPALFLRVVRWRIVVLLSRSWAGVRE